MRLGGVVVAGLLVLAACAGGETGSGSAVAPPTVPAGDVLSFSDVSAEVYVPDGDGPFPAVVVVHGGGWTSGTPGMMAGVVVMLQADGFLVVNTSYQLSTPERPGFPHAVDDVACAVRHAAAHPDSDGTVTVLGYSAGAQLASLVAMAGADFGGDCDVVSAVEVDRLVALGLAGVGGVANGNRFFQERFDEAPDAWEAGNPLTHVDRNPGLEALFVHGEYDSVVLRSTAADLVEALRSVGAEADLVDLPEVDHRDLTDPDLVGSTIVDWLAATA